MPIDSDTLALLDRVLRRTATACDAVTIQLFVTNLQHSTVVVQVSLHDPMGEMKLRVSDASKFLWRTSPCSIWAE